ncbi:hypothetical protein RHMOL_Rhmol11G0054600 [Rhododendron molle]|uniref:Uncharacterized protein n=1 Tax=Rhododendron molle TaxID=49168 RepID=A0ACC0LPY3_RHOML|nr:hypothetical protein RHMOL_Rhmol11G0054600 [Rhododendron molle]
MAPKMDKALLAKLKAERVKQSYGAVAPKRKSSHLQKELSVDSFLKVDRSIIPSVDLVVESLVEGEIEKSKRKAKGAAVEGIPPCQEDEGFGWPFCVRELLGELQKVTNERDAALKLKMGLEEERDTAVATAQSLE